MLKNRTSPQSYGQEAIEFALEIGMPAMIVDGITYE